MKNKFFIHKSSFIDQKAQIGDGTKIWHFSHISKGAKIGKRCILGQNVFVGENVVIGDDVKIQNNVSVYENIIIENDVFCGPSVVFTNVKTPRSFISRKSEFMKTLICKGASIGANSTIICGTKIGSYSFIAAGAVLTKDCKAHSLMIGVPAIQKGWVSHAGEVLGKDLKCPRENKKYKIEKGFLIYEK